MSRRGWTVPPARADASTASMVHIEGDRIELESAAALQIALSHELLRQAALILGAGWSKGSNARDSAGRIVLLFNGASRNARDDAGRIVDPHVSANRQHQSGRLCHLAPLRHHPHEKAQAPRRIFHKSSDVRQSNSKRGWIKSFRSRLREARFFIRQADPISGRFVGLFGVP